MSEILAIIQHASPALAAVIIGLVFAVRTQGKDIERLKNRVDKLEALDINSRFAKIESDLSWIRAHLEGKI